MKLDGITVYDARTPAVLNIKPADTNTGKKDPANCAAAKAACRLPGAIEARVYRTRTYVLMNDARTGKKFWRRYVTPDAIRVEVISFDRGGSFSTGEYTLREPKLNARLGLKHSEKNRRRVGPKKSRPAPHIVPGIRERAPGKGERE